MQSTATSSLELHSTAFEHDSLIPPRYTCDGENVSPPLRWLSAPAGTQAFALIVTDYDAQGFVHWVLADIPGTTTELPEGEGDSIGVPGGNDFGALGWGGPCPPPSGIHQYVFHLYALSAPLRLHGTPTVAAIEAHLGDLALAHAELTGTYRRQGVHPA